MRTLLPGLSPSTRRRQPPTRSWLAAFAAALLLAALATGTATAATTGATGTSDHPTVVSDWNQISFSPVAVG